MKEPNKEDHGSLLVRGQHPKALLIYITLIVLMVLSFGLIWNPTDSIPLTVLGITVLIITLVLSFITGAGIAKSDLDHLNAAKRLLRAGKVDAAIRQLEQVTGPNSRFTKGWVAYGDVLMQKGDYSGAIEKYRKAVEFAPVYSLDYEKSVEDALIGWAKALRLTGHPQEGYSKVEEVTKNNPNSARAFAEAGYCLLDAEHAFDAIQKLNVSVQIKPSYDAYIAIAAAYERLGNQMEAAAARESAMLLKTDNSSAQ